jgi:hypothetical protein
MRRQTAMIEAKAQEYCRKTYSSKAFNIKAESNGYQVKVEYKPGFIPFYKLLFAISADMVPQLIEVLEGLQEVLIDSTED